MLPLLISKVLYGRGWWCLKAKVVAFNGFVWEVVLFNKWLSFKKAQSVWKSIKVLFLGCIIVLFFFFLFTICYSSILSFSITIDVQGACQLIAFYKLFCKLNTNNMTACKLLVVMVFLLCSGQCHIKNITSQLLFASTKYLTLAQ